MGLSLATQLRTQTILGLCDTRAVAANEKVGFARDRELGTQGTFEYPRRGLNAHVLRVADAARLEGATADDWHAIDEYRDEPVGRELLQGRDGWLELERDLRLAAAVTTPCPPCDRLTERRGVEVAPALGVRF
jgi:hypothetical protein